MNQEWSHKFTATKNYLGKDYGGSRRISVEAGLHHLQGNSRPYFSVTGEIGRPGARDCDTCGCIHPEILAYWPELAPVIALHLSDDLGQPMHMEANGWYQLAGYYSGADEQYHAGNSQGHHGGEYRHPTPAECLQQFAEHVRIPLSQAQELAEQWRNSDDWKASRRWFGQWLETQAKRFNTEAMAARRLLNELIAGQK